MLPDDSECGVLERVQLTPSMIPKSPNFDVKDSQFFRKFTKLPSPEEVRLQAKAQHLAEGGIVRTSEGQCLYALGQLLKDDIPIPEIYGWREDGGETFLYMEYLQGQTLEQVWDNLGPDNRVSICYELRTIVNHIRRLQQKPGESFVGDIAQDHLYDRVFEVKSPEAGTFNTVREFHDWFTFLHRRPMPDPYIVPIEPFRQDLPDDSEIKFTHSDLHRSNILITRSEPYRVLAVVDWEQSGWLPMYLEARKAQYTADTQEWSKKYLPMILCQYTSTWDTWAYYTAALGVWNVEKGRVLLFWLLLISFLHKINGVEISPRDSVC
ncbi:hypothetical protein CBS147332_2280 [Penicillium roqueforti]|nr:hypothetical protein CBS147332_2280 [Penicillium roqueforti]KAI3109797.1 hypothetical protein CBS147331_5226 [Penicillium roqueforti]KAI3166907.1 hypothetical protein DTO039G3_6174 [Penicillium roqueforti]